MVLAGLANTRIECSHVQLLQIEVPGTSSETTCEDYLAPFMRSAGGRLMNSDALSQCLYCPVDQTNNLLEQLGMETSHVWYNAGYLVIYVIFNTAAIFFIYYSARVMKIKK